jgi:hypothetical protein
LTEAELRPSFGGPGGRGEGRGPANVNDIVARYLSLDKNEDGKLGKDEVPERMQGLFTRGDEDKDDVLSKEELNKLAERQIAAGGPGGFGGPGGPGGFGGGAAGFGPPSPEAFVNRALEFDADKDSKLSKEELGKMAEQMGRGFGGRGGQGRRDEGDDRPQRPARPESDN